MEDRQRIIDRISLLDMNQMRGIIPIVKQFLSSEAQIEEKLEFDLYELPDDKCKELHNYVETCIHANK